MSAGLGHTPAGHQDHCNLPAKNVDEALKNRGFDWESLVPYGAFGSPTSKRNFLKKISGKGGKSADKWFATTCEPVKIDIDAKLVERLATKLTPNFLKGDTRVIASYFEPATEMAQEWDFIKQERDARDHTEVAGYLPIQLRAFLEKMTPARRRERELAILKNCGWEGVEVIDLDADELAQRAKKIAALYAAAHPANDKDFKEPEHKRGRCEKEQVRRLRKAQRKALAYVNAALGAVGGPIRDGRPLYISDYALRCYRQQESRTAKILEGLRLIKKSDPKCQISMTEVNAKAQICEKQELD